MPDGGGKGNLRFMERSGEIVNACEDICDDEALEGTAASRRIVPTEIRQPEDIRPAAEALREIAKEVANFRVAACDNIASKLPMRDIDGSVLASDVFGWPASKEQWWKKPLLALTSPLTVACRYESDPFWANADGIRSRADNPLLESVDMTKFGELVNGEAALVVPVHLPFGQIGVVSFSPIEAGRADLSYEFEAYSDQLEFHARRFITGYSRVTSRRPWIPKGCRLSKREVECLRWAAVGKTDIEIAMLIERSCATVRFHIHNASTKLEAVNRSQTVFKATQLGYLGSVAVMHREIQALAGGTAGAA